MSPQKFFNVMIVLVVSILLVLIPAHQGEATEKVFKLGILAPFSGPTAITGKEFRGSVMMAFDAIDWKIGEYKIEPVWIDSQFNSQIAQEAYKKAVVEDGIQAGILNWHSEVSVACMEVTAQYKIPHFFGFGATELVNQKFRSDPEKYGYWMYKGWPMPEKLCISYVQVLEEAIKKGIWHPANKTFVIYGEDTAWGRSFGNALKAQLEETGWTIVDEEYFAKEQSVFYPWLTKLKKLDPDLIAGTATIPDSLSVLINQADEIRLRSLIIADGLGWFGGWYALSGKSANYVLDQIPQWATEKGKQYAAEYQERFGITPSPSAAGLAYDGTNFFIAVANAAIEQYGELSSESIYSFVKENVWTGKWSYKGGLVMSEYAATPETIPDPVVGKGYYIFPVLQYFDGVGKIIFPPEWAEQELQPKP